MRGDDFNPAAEDPLNTNKVTRWLMKIKVWILDAEVNTAWRVDGECDTDRPVLV